MSLAYDVREERIAATALVSLNSGMRLRQELDRSDLFGVRSSLRLS